MSSEKLIFDNDLLTMSTVTFFLLITRKITYTLGSYRILNTLIHIYTTIDPLQNKAGHLTQTEIQPTCWWLSTSRHKAK